MTDMIVIINPSDGTVEGTVDCSGLLPRSLRDANTDVLNGIADNPKGGKILPSPASAGSGLYEVRLVGE